MRLLIALTLVPFVFFLPGCDLQHLPEKIECWQADDDRLACQAISDICTPDGGPRCEGTEGSACASMCGASDDGASCILETKYQGICGAQGFVSNMGAFNGPRNETGWNLLPLDREIWGPRVGDAIDAELLAEMTPRQRRAVCATSRTLDATGRSPCILSWDARRGHAACERLEEPCAECTLEVTEFRCIPKNLCRGMICF